MLRRNGASSTLDDRRFFAREAFAVSSGYDSDIFNYFSLNAAPTDLRIAVDGAKHLRYV